MNDVATGRRGVIDSDGDIACFGHGMRCFPIAQPAEVELFRTPQAAELRDSRLADYAHRLNALVDEIREDQEEVRQDRHLCILATEAGLVLAWTREATDDDDTGSFNEDIEAALGF